MCLGRLTLLLVLILPSTSVCQGWSFDLVLTNQSIPSTGLKFKAKCTSHLMVLGLLWNSWKRKTPQHKTGHTICDERWASVQESSGRTLHGLCSQGKAPWRKSHLRWNLNNPSVQADQELEDEHPCGHWKNTSKGPNWKIKQCVRETKNELGPGLSRGREEGVLDTSEMSVKVAQSCPTLWLYSLYSPWSSPGQNTGVGSLSLLQGIFPTQGSNPGLPRCRQMLYQLSPQRSPQGPNFCRAWCHVYALFRNHGRKPEAFMLNNDMIQFMLSRSVTLGKPLGLWACIFLLCKM